MLLLSFCGGLSAQQLYISKMDTWFRQGSAGGNGYCSDVDSSITVAASNSGAISGTFTGADDGWAMTGIISGTRYLDSLGADGACTSASEGAFNATAVSGVFSAAPGTITGTLNGFEGFANGTVSGTVLGEPTGSVAAIGTMHCVPTDNLGPGSEGFESGDLTNGGVRWVNQGNAFWGVQSGVVDSGFYAAKAGTIGNSQYSALSVGLHVTSPGSVSFRYRVSSEAGFDYLRFYIDGVQSGASWSGAGVWTTHTSGALTSGFHVLRWVYSKDGSLVGGSDTAWLDNISFPGHTRLYNGTAVPSGAAVNLLVYGTDNGAGLISAVVSQETITGPLTCTAGPSVCTPGSRRWLSSGPTDDRARGTVTGTVSGPPVFTDTKVSFYTSLTGEAWTDSALIQYERPKGTYPGGCLGLCASIMCVVGSTPAVFGIDDLTFDIFKFGPGANPLDPSSTPPIKTVSMFNIGMCDSADSYPPNQFGSRIPIGTFCTAWDGSYNLNGYFGKTNGQFGYRAKVTTRQTTAQGSSIDIEQTAAYPGQNQIPIQIDVTNIHLAQSNPTGVGNQTRVPAQPYNLKYRLSKDATATLTIWDTDVSHQTGSAMTLVRTIVSSQPRVGEGVPDGVLTNGDWWDGRNTSGAIVPAGSYIARIEAGSNDDWSMPPFNGGDDVAWPADIQMTLDPLQVTDVGMRPLGVSATDMAVISYMLTEAATAYVDIYTPGTRFVNTDVSPPVLVGGSGTLLKRFMEQEGGRQTTSVYWDGRDLSGSPVCDGDYVYAIYAEMPSTGQIGNFTWNSVKTRRTTVGTIPVARGSVLAFMSPSSTVMGSSPTAAGLDPFFFRYTPARNTTVSLNIKSMDGGAGAIIKNLVNGEVRFANVLNRESWDGKRNDGSYVSSGTYLAELVTTDPYLCAAQATSTMTVQFPVHMFRILDVRGSSLLGGASAYATVSFELSQTMQVELKIYEPDQVVNPSLWPWPAGTFPDPLFTAQGLRPGRMRITEPWDGRDKNGLLVPDGHYPFTLVAYTTGTAEVVYATDKVYGYVDVSRGQILFSMFDVFPTIPTMYNSSDTIKLPPYTIEYAVTRQSSVTVQVVTLDMPPYVVAEVVTGAVRDGDTLYKDFWDGKCTATAYCGHTDYVPGGDYNVRVMAQDLGVELKPRATVQQTIDVFPIRIFDLSITPLTIDSPAVVSYQLSEPMKMVTKIYKPGTNLPGLGDPTNTLVKRIIGVRPARTQISEYWDGTDLTLAKVSDGNYVFRLYGTTVTSNIDTLTGNAIDPGLLADDIIVSNIPVVKSGTEDLCGDFARETFFAPNPYTGTSGWFKIPAIMNGRLGLHIYNLAGDLVYTKDFGERGGGNNVDGNGQCVTAHTNPACWPKVNASGRTVAPGVYLAVIRFEATEGTRDVCQAVKKILIP